MRIRIIPTLLLHKGGLVKSVKFDNYKYLGDPINAVKIFNEKEVDEIAVIDIDATREKRDPDYDQIAEIASEAFMPLSYGGGITSLEQIKKILYNGVEKIIVNKVAHLDPQVITDAARQFGSQSIVVSIDVKKTLVNGNRVFTDNGKVKTPFTPVEFAKKMEEAGAGEILLNNINADGTFAGFNLQLIQSVSDEVNIPVIAIGGAASIEDLVKACESGAAAVAAASIFVFQSKQRGVLISYPSQDELKHAFYRTIL